MGSVPRSTASPFRFPGLGGKWFLRKACSNCRLLGCREEQRPKQISRLPLCNQGAMGPQAPHLAQLRFSSQPKGLWPITRSPSV